MNEALDYGTIGDKVAAEVGKHIKTLVERLAEKDKQINELKSQVLELQCKYDDMEQYSRKRNLRIDGIVEQAGENTHEVIVDLCNNAMQLDPPISLADIDNSHRVPSRSARPGPSSIIVKFTSYRARRRVYVGRTRLKGINRGRQPATATSAPDAARDAAADPAEGASQTTAADRQPSSVRDWSLPGPPIWINEDLSKGRGEMCYQARDLKRKGKILDVWTFDCKVKIKDLNGRIINIDRVDQLVKYRE